VTDERERIEITNKGAWLDLRRRDVTASQVAALFSEHKWLTMLMLWQQKRGEDGQQGDSPAMRRGRILEPAVAEAVKEENPEWAPIIRKANEYWRLPAMRLGATPDYYIGEPGTPGFGLLEAKTVSPDQFEIWNGSLPLAYTLQCLAQQMCTGAAWGTVAVLVTNRGFDLHMYAVPRHAAAEAKIAAAVAEFWRAVDAGEQPPPVMPQDRETLIRMFPKDDGSSLDLNFDNELPVLLAERASLKVATKRLVEIDETIKAKLGSAATAFCSDWRISYRAHERAEYTVPAKTVRSLRITRKGMNGDADG